MYEHVPLKYTSANLSDSRHDFKRDYAHNGIRVVAFLYDYPHTLTSSLNKASCSTLCAYLIRNQLALYSINFSWTEFWVALTSCLRTGCALPRNISWKKHLCKSYSSRNLYHIGDTHCYITYKTITALFYILKSALFCTLVLNKWYNSTNWIWRHTLKSMGYVSRLWPPTDLRHAMSFEPIILSRDTCTSINPACRFQDSPDYRGNCCLSTGRFYRALRIKNDWLWWLAHHSHSRGLYMTFIKLKNRARAQLLKPRGRL